MKRRKFLSLTPSSVFLPSVIQYCTDDEFTQPVVAEGELRMGAKWAITSLDYSKSREASTEREFSSLPAVYNIETTHQNTTPTYLDEGNEYTISFNVAVPVRHALDGVAFEFSSFGGFPWKLLFDFTYYNKSGELQYYHPPKQSYVVYTVQYTFEFELSLKRFFVMLDDRTEDVGEENENVPERRASWGRTPQM